MSLLDGTSASGGASPTPLAGHLHAHAGNIVAATVRRELRSRGEDGGMADSLIAGIALAAGAELLTRKRRHFGRVPSLRLAAAD